MRKITYLTLAILIVGGCSQNIQNNSPSIKSLIEFKDTMDSLVLSSKAIDTKVVDARKIVTRQMIEDAGISLLFVEKNNGTNGTFSLFPGENIEETWLGADGATISLYNGELVATRGIGIDLMGSLLPRFKAFNERLDISYEKKMRYLTSDNQIDNKNLLCNMIRSVKNEDIFVFELKHTVRKYSETCIGDGNTIKNEFWRDLEGNHVMSKQYHSNSSGYLLLMRLN